MFEKVKKRNTKSNRNRNFFISIFTQCIISNPSRDSDEDLNLSRRKKKSTAGEEKNTARNHCLLPSNLLLFLFPFQGLLCGISLPLDVYPPSEEWEALCKIALDWFSRRGKSFKGRKHLRKKPYIHWSHAVLNVIQNITDSTPLSPARCYYLFFTILINYLTP